MDSVYLQNKMIMEEICYEQDIEKVERYDALYYDDCYIRYRVRQQCR